MTKLEEVARAMADALRANCTNVRGECYAHGFDPCPQEGGRAGEVDGEFDLEKLARAALTALRTPTLEMCFAMCDVPAVALGNGRYGDPSMTELWQAAIDTILGDQP